MLAKKTETFILDLIFCAVVQGLMAIFKSFFRSHLYFKRHNSSKLANIVQLTSDVNIYIHLVKSFRFKKDSPMV